MNDELRSILKEFHTDGQATILNHPEFVSFENWLMMDFYELEKIDTAFCLATEQIRSLPADVCLIGFGLKKVC